MCDYHANPDWLYSGDINAEHGGIWIRHHGDYCDAIRIEDLDSACGFDGAVLIERLSVSLPRKLSDAKARIKNAFRCCDQHIADIAKHGPAYRRAVTWEALIAYGYCDCDCLETLQLSADGPMRYDGWTADRRQTRGDIGGYVMAKYLD